MNPQPDIRGRLVRINGPIVEAEGLGAAGMLDVVEVGALRLIGEVIRLLGDVATIQVYENTGGLKPGDPVFATGRPLSVELGPGLLGSIFDGIQRPLPAIAKHSGLYINRGEKTEPLDRSRAWPFQPVAALGSRLGPGRVFGTVRETPSIEHRLMIPPDWGEVEVLELAPAGDCTLAAVLGRVRDEAGSERELRMSGLWPVRRPRPAAGRLAMTRPLLTGLRVIDALFPLARGGTAAIPGGFGTGKTMTQHALAKWSEADIRSKSVV